MSTNKAALAVAGLIIGICGGLVASEAIGIFGVVVLGQELGIRFLPLFCGLALALAVPALAAKIGKGGKRDGQQR